MDIYLILLYIVLFLSIGGGTAVFWKNKEVIAQNIQKTLGLATATSQQTQVNVVKPPPQDAMVGDYITGECMPNKGKCGKGTLQKRRVCLREGENGGRTCSELADVKEADCWRSCDRPRDILDWGHSNDKVQKGPLKGWYDFTGQGIPNDYCRWVGDAANLTWACQTNDDPYVKANPNHLTFSGGPANRLNNTWDADMVAGLCPKYDHYTRATDPDLQKSIANGFFSHCGATCIYDYRNPHQGWIWNGSEYVRIPDMSKHVCGTQHVNEMQGAMQQYDRFFDTKNAWSV